MYKSVIVIALCAFTFAQCISAEESSEESASYDRVRRQMPMPGDMMNIPLKAGADMAHTFTGFGEKMMNPGMGGGMGGMGGGMGGGPMGK